MANQRRRGRPRTKALSRDDVEEAKRLARAAVERYAKHKAIQRYARTLRAALDCARAVIGDGGDDDDADAQVLEAVAKELEALARKVAAARRGKDVDLTVRGHVDQLCAMLTWADIEVARLERVGIAPNAETEAQQILIARGASTYDAVRAIGGHDDSEPSAALPGTRPVQIAAQKRRKRRRVRIEQLENERASWANQPQDRSPLTKGFAAERIAAIDAEISAVQTVPTGARSRRKRRTQQE